MNANIPDLSSEGTLRHRAAASVPSPPAATEAPQPPPSAATTEGGSTFMDALFSSLFQPGLNPPLHNLMNFTFYALFVSLAALIFLTSGNVHVIALLTIAVGLWASVNWFLAELKKLPVSTFQVQTAPPESQSEEPQEQKTKS
ncbi:Pkr1-domain-containing protein [Tilletiaria anomala UBC 951]|uniref:Pkr1-domain-containing protein n=1 Tax=Tilletiaria anomala (strain ATCC 24038 / CBS 436.72 / UBC 951) TaxID=1037660 RepID=A0A066VE59_TILAU|nr:Pkr1-domain-containing protein [Tilletiaria anomala UBC 951]KDN40032.1 Pkr1-domain-containing protein [Tilletiaria anomala UBC 951]